MATNEQVRVTFVTAYDGKGLNQARAQLGSFDLLANKAVKTFASFFAIQKVTAFGKATVDAFTADQAAAQNLSKTLVNLGLGLQAVGVEDFIQKLETATGVLDDQLRPAFARLARQTNNVGKTQELLNLALDVSAGTGNDLMTVSNALAKAYGGQFTSLSKLGAGLTKADLASGNFNLIQAKLTKLFQGQAAAAAETYAGKIKRLGVAFDNMKETVGLGLINAFTALSGPNGSIATTTTMIENLGYAINGWLQGFSTFVAGIEGVFSKISSNPVIKWIISHSGIGRIKDVLGTLVDAGKMAAYNEKLRQNTKTLEQYYKNQKAIYDATQKQLALDKAALVLKQASKTLDLQQIEIFAAMQQAQGNDLDRLKLQQAILDGNASAAESLAKKVLAANSLVMDLQGNIKTDPLHGWVISSQDFLNNLLDSLNVLKGIQSQAAALVGPSAAQSQTPGYTPAVSSLISTMSVNPNLTSIGGQGLINALATQAMQTGAQEIKVTVDPTAMAYGITLATQNQSSNGVSVGTSRNNPTYLNPSSGL